MSKATLLARLRGHRMLTMYDSVDAGKLPAGGDAYAGYVSGNWPTYATVAARFPRAHLLSIAPTAAHDADCLDVEAGDATPADAPGWVRRQQARGVTRPVLYASASTIPAVIGELTAAGIGRSAVRLWSAHYGSKHICGPTSCRWPGVPACDGTQWKSDNTIPLDTSLLVASFFTSGAGTGPAPARTPEDIMISGQLAAPKTDIVLPDGISHIRFGCSVKATVAVDLRDGKPETVLTLDSGSAQAIPVPSSCHMVVAHVTAPAADGTAPGFAAW